MDGLILVDKEKGWTSHDVVAVLKGKLKINKIGHAGTLDPNATGLLIVLAGNATKRFEEFKSFDKEYLAEITFGMTTDTDDADGKVIERLSDKVIKLDEEKIKNILKNIVGERMQRPPAISAVKVNGVRAYKLARQGKITEIIKMTEKKITIYEAELLDLVGLTAKIRFVVSSGTYIRSIARELGEVTGYGAYLSNLRRTRIGKWKVEGAKKLGEITPDDNYSD